MSVHVARRRGLKNFSLLVSHVLVPPAIEAIMGSRETRCRHSASGPRVQRDGLLGVSAAGGEVQGALVVTGFEPLDLLDGIRRAVVQLEAGRHEVENAYERIVTYDGNQAAQKLLAEVFDVTDRAWRGIGVIPKSGWRLSEAYRGLTPRSASTSPAFIRRSRRCAGRGMCSAGSSSRRSARHSEKNARRGIRLVRRWFPARAPAPLITTMGGLFRLKSWRVPERGCLGC